MAELGLVIKRREAQQPPIISKMSTGGSAAPAPVAPMSEADHQAVQQQINALLKTFWQEQLQEVRKHENL